GVCDCGQPYLVRYSCVPPPAVKSQLAGRSWTMWRYREWLPLGDGEAPVTLGEGGTPLLAAPRLGARHGFADLWVKEEGVNPTGSFKARGLAAAVTRATLAGARRGRRGHPPRALRHRRQEDPRPRAGGAARLDPAAGNRVPHGWRHRADRHVEGVRRASAGGVGNRVASADVQRAGRRLRAGR